MRSFLRWFSLAAALSLLVLLLFADSVWSRHTSRVSALPLPHVDRHEANERATRVRTVVAFVSDASIEDDLVLEEIAAITERRIAMDRATDGAFTRTLDAVLSDPARSVAMYDGSFRHPKREGIDQLLAYFPEPTSDLDEQASWMTMNAIAALYGCETDAECARRYLLLAARRPYREILFDR